MKINTDRAITHSLRQESYFLGFEIDIAYDYGIILKENQFKNSGNYACVPFRLTLAYAIAFCLDAGCEVYQFSRFFWI